MIGILLRVRRIVFGGWRMVSSGVGGGVSYRRMVVIGGDGIRFRVLRVIAMIRSGGGVIAWLHCGCRWLAID